MNVAIFDQWLKQYITSRGFPLDSRTRQSRVSNCLTVEKHEGSLDDHYDQDGMSRLLGRLQYSTDDWRAGMAPKHRIPINGDIYNGTATLRSAVNLYKKFRDSKWSPVKLECHNDCTNPLIRNCIKSNLRSARNKWPVWKQPSEVEALELAKIVSKFARYLSPKIVDLITRDNEKRSKEWRERLSVLGIEPDSYLWDGSPCAFPGIRRYSGSAEIAAYRKKAADSDLSLDALCLDDNDYPKQIWAFTFTHRKFAKHGPPGYALAHLIDHKPHKNRIADEFEGVTPSLSLPIGLYTCPSNTVYTPNALIRPTDFEFLMRNLMVRRSHAIYGAVCNIVPPCLSVRKPDVEDWDLGKFNWAEPVGDVGTVEDFLEFRARTLDSLFNNVERARPAKAD